MPHRFISLNDVYTPDFDDIIDVRSPAEFAEDHVPGAISLPVLSDAERAKVGTVYKQESPFKARKIGAALVARNAADHIAGPLADRDGGWKPLVYCWRGGQRSGSFASILSQIGWRAEVIDGGYRTYRRIVVALLHDTPLPHTITLLDGNTGTAKTELLSLLAQRGVQVVDLEALAAHRGSVFGAVSTPQPAQKAFESALARAFTALDPHKPTVLEAESSKIGNLYIPPSLWARMRTAPRIQISAPLQARARYLTTAYADMIEQPDTLLPVLDRLVAFHGYEQVKIWQAMARTGQFESLAAQLMDRHYDHRYTKSRKTMATDGAQQISLTDLRAPSLNAAADSITTLL